MKWLSGWKTRKVSRWAGPYTLIGAHEINCRVRREEEYRGVRF